MKITASIVTYKTDREELRRCLCSLSSPLVDHIYIVDNSPEESLRNFCDEFSNVEYIYNGANLGYGAAHNVAIRKSLKRGTLYHLVLNSDVYFDSEVISRIYEFMQNNADVAQLIPDVRYPDGKRQYVCRMLPSPANLVFRRFLPQNVIQQMDSDYLMMYSHHQQSMNVPYLQGSFMFFRNSCFEKIGLFDERFFMYPEDIDITRRMHREYRTLYWPEVSIVHAHRAASYKSKRMLFIHVWNMIKYFNKWGWIFDDERKKWNRRLVEKYTD